MLNRFSLWNKLLLICYQAFCQAEIAYFFAWPEELTDTIHGRIVLLDPPKSMFKQKLFITFTKNLYSVLIFIEGTHLLGSGNFTEPTFIEAFCQIFPFICIDLPQMNHICFVANKHEGHGSFRISDC